MDIVSLVSFLLTAALIISLMLLIDILCYFLK